MSSLPELKTGQRQLTSSVFRVVRLTIGWWPGPSMPPRLKRPSTKLNAEDLGGSSMSISSELIFNPPLFVTVSLVLPRAEMIPRSMMPLRWLRCLNEVVTALLDAHAPMTEITCRVRRSSDKWYDSECRSAKRRARGHERRFKRSRTDAARDSWMRSLKTMHHLVRSKRKQFWRSRVDTGRDQASL